MSTARIVFMGTPEFAVPSLRALNEHASVVGVVTQPDRPAGRGQKLIESPVKQCAASYGLPVIQPARLREPEAMAQLTAWRPDVIIVAAFGQILQQAVLALPPHGCLNIHASLLPRWRGAAPIAAAIAAGDAETGITLMQIDVGLDTGPMLAKRAETIRADDITATLTARLALLGAELLIATLPHYLSGAIIPQPQDNSLATYAPQLKKEDGQLDFTRPALELARQVRAFTPWPGAFARWNGQRLKILRAAVTEARGEPGALLTTEAGPAVACGEGALLLLEVQPPGKRPMTAADFVRGARHFLGARLE
ncbi:MAG: methionyl-tRNA formyltransferase [Anaerolineales bacterium]